MTWQFNPYSIPLFIGIITMFALTFIARRYKDIPSAQFFLVFTLAVTGLMITYTLELQSASLPQILTWVKLEYLFSLTIPTLFLLFVLSYHHYASWLTSKRIGALFIIPAIHIALVWTNEYHSLNWESVAVDASTGVVLFSRVYGPAFWLGMIYQYGVAVIASTVLLLTVVRSRNLHQQQAIPLILSVGCVWASHLLTVLEMSFIRHLDLTPFGYGVTCGLIAWSLFRYKLFEIMPAAHGAVIRGMSDSVIVVDAQQRVIELNPAAEQLIGHTARQVIGQPTPLAFAAVPDLLCQCFAPQEIERELTLRIKDEPRYFDQRISPLYNERMQLTGFVMVLRDMTRLKQAEEAARRYAAELEERNSELDAFSHTIAHDLKAPLTLVGGYAEIVLAREGAALSPRGQQYVESIRSAAIKMTDMINELLRLSSVRDVGSVITDVDMNGVAQAAIARFETDIERRGFQIEIMPDLPQAKGHALWIEEVFANLISNAIKYAGKDNPAPRIVINGAQQGNCIRYEVRDNGLGIAPPDQARLFSAFARFHKNEASGVGLGLTIVLRIVKRLNGQVGVESAPGSGSVFWFTLPAAQPTPLREPLLYPARANVEAVEALIPDQVAL